MENSFQTIDGKNMVYSNSFLKYRDEYDIPSCRYRSGEIINGDVYEKMHIVS